MKKIHRSIRGMEAGVGIRLVLLPCNFCHKHSIIYYRSKYRDLVWSRQGAVPRHQHSHKKKLEFEQ